LTLFFSVWFAINALHTVIWKKDNQTKEILFFEVYKMVTTENKQDFDDEFSFGYFPGVL